MAHRLPLRRVRLTRFRFGRGSLWAVLVVFVVFLLGTSRFLAEGVRRLRGCTCGLRSNTRRCDKVGAAPSESPGFRTFARCRACEAVADDFSALCACGVPPLSSTEQDSVIVLPGGCTTFGTISARPSVRRCIWRWRFDSVDRIPGRQPSMPSPRRCPDLLDRRSVLAGRGLYRMCDCHDGARRLSNCQSTVPCRATRSSRRFIRLRFTQQQSCVVDDRPRRLARSRETVTLTGTGHWRPPIDLSTCSRHRFQFGEVRVGDGLGPASTISVRGCATSAGSDRCTSRR